MAKSKTISKTASLGFELWFQSCPGVPNPTDMNTREKYYFAMWFCSTYGVRYFAEMIGWRKGTKPCPETQYEFWSEKYPLPATPCVRTRVDEYDRNKAKLLFCEWFSLYPELENPTDINFNEKFEFLQEIGWEGAVMMEKARKQNTATNGYPNPWTKPKFWDEKKTVQVS